jgi:hypothetical protein
MWDTEGHLGYTTDTDASDASAPGPKQKGHSSPVWCTLSLNYTALTFTLIRDSSASVMWSPCTCYIQPFVDFFKPPQGSAFLCSSVCLETALVLPMTQQPRSVLTLKGFLKVQKAQEQTDVNCARTSHIYLLPQLKVHTQLSINATPFALTTCWWR